MRIGPSSLILAPVAGGTMIGLPALKNFAKPAIRDRVLQQVLDGKKLVSLAITEAFAGSDVAGIRTTAIKSADGKTWTVTGTFRNLSRIREASHICSL